MAPVSDAPERPGGGLRLARLVADAHRRAAAMIGETMGTSEIRLTYRELSALIEDAIRNLR